MTAILVTSITRFAGKTMLCAGLSKCWQTVGRKVGYFKPIFSQSERTKDEEKSLSMIKSILGLTETVEVISPLLQNDPDAIKAAFKSVSQDKEIILIESAFNQAELLASALDIKMLVVHDYSQDMEKAVRECSRCSSVMMGIIFNKIPVRKLAAVSRQPEGVTTAAGLKLYGAIPENRMLAALSVGDLAEILDGKILNNPEKSSDLIENIMVGSSTFDRGAAYYQRKNNKAVLVWGERPGYRKAAVAALPQAALQTSTRCVVISDASVPLPAIIQKAAEKGVPFISAPGKLTELIAKLEKAMSAISFAQEQKMAVLTSQLTSSLASELINGDFRSR
jgi:uncharacterized protein